MDGLRAIAVLAVVVDHIAWHYHGRPPAAMNAIAGLPWHVAMWHLLLEGSHGVDLFFVLSGFCLSYPFLSRLAAGSGHAFDASQFFAKRIVRIVPPYYAALIIFAIPRMMQHYATLNDVVKQLFFTSMNTGNINEAFWTLAVEFRWYLVFPLVLWLWIRQRALFWALLAAAVAVFNFATPIVDVGTLPGFMLGIVAAHIYVRQSPWRRAALPALVALVPVAIFAETLYRPVGASMGQASFAQIQISWQLAAFAFVVTASSYDGIRKLLSLPWIAAIGVASYSIYLTHAPLVGGLANSLPALNAPAFACVALAVALAIGFGFWKFVERPFVEGDVRATLVGRIGAAIRNAGQTLQFPKPSRRDADVRPVES